MVSLNLVILLFIATYICSADALDEAMVTKLYCQMMQLRPDNCFLAGVRFKGHYPKYCETKDYPKSYEKISLSSTLMFQVSQFDFNRTIYCHEGIVTGLEKSRVAQNDQTDHYIFGLFEFPNVQLKCTFAFDFHGVESKKDVKNIAAKGEIRFALLSTVVYIPVKRAAKPVDQVMMEKTDYISFANTKDISFQIDKKPLKKLSKEPKIGNLVAAMKESQELFKKEIARTVGKIFAELYMRGLLCSQPKDLGPI